jgi:hypothetical protein
MKYAGGVPIVVAAYLGRLQFAQAIDLYAQRQTRVPVAGFALHQDAVLTTLPHVRRTVAIGVSLGERQLIVFVTAPPIAGTPRT